MKDSYRSRLYAIAPDNAGIITIASAAAVGVPAVELRKIAARGGLERAGRGVYRVPFYPVDNLSEYIEVTDIVGPDSYIGGDSVLMLLDIGLAFPKTIEVISHGRNRRSTPSYAKVTVRPGSPRYDYINGVRCEPVFDVLMRQIGKKRNDRAKSEIQEALTKEFITNSQAAALMAMAEKIS